MVVNTYKIQNGVLCTHIKTHMINEQLAKSDCIIKLSDSIKWRNYMSTKKTILVSILIIMLMTSTAFAGSIYTTKETDREDIENITNTFFTEKEQAFLSDNCFNIAEYTGAIDDKNIENDSSFDLFEYEKQIRDDNYSDISDEKLSYTINSIAVTGNTAKVKVYEQYEYTYKNDPERSSRGIEYQITFSQKDNKWEMLDISTNNELETLIAEAGNSSEKYIFDFDIEEEADEENTENDARATTAASGTTHEYNRADAAAYALKYSDSTHTSSATSAYNSKFPQFAPSDCQNFVSQCVWAGLGGDNTAATISKKKPMITTTGRAWYCTSSGHTSSWTVVGTFRDYIAKEADNEEGIYGIRYAKGNIEKAQKGDVVQICDSSGTWYHSYIISSVTGTYGSRTLSDIKICAHTSNRRNETLSNVIGASSTNFRLIRISGTRY